MNRRPTAALIAVILLLPQAPHLTQADIITPDTRAALINALSTASPGDQILLQPGTYAGGIFTANLTGITIGSLDPDNPAVIQGGTNAIQLSDPNDVIIQDLILENATGNGLNIDDGGSFETPAQNITLRNLIVRNIGSTGNNDGIKLSGVNNFHIHNVHVDTWGAGGSAIDMVGSHHGLIENSLFTHPTISNTGSGVRPKGGSKDVTIRANRIELTNGQGRAVQFGGSTDPEFFRYLDSDSGYEADQMTAQGNIVIGGSSAFSWSVIDGGDIHHNLIHRPDDWVLRILNENTAVGSTLNGRFFDNTIVFGDELNTHVNQGPDTQPETFLFARNHWYNADDPTDSNPSLPANEDSPTVGIDPNIDLSGPLVFEFDWGFWLINPNPTDNQVELTTTELLSRGSPSTGAQFNPLQSNPLIGGWSLTPFPGGNVDLEPFSQAVFVNNSVPEPAAVAILVFALIVITINRRSNVTRKNK